MVFIVLSHQFNSATSRFQQVTYNEPITPPRFWTPNLSPDPYKPELRIQFKRLSRVDSYHFHSLITSFWRLKFTNPQDFSFIHRINYRIRGIVMDSVSHRVRD
ncbi:hypothetical protein IMY05_003G0133600 [Salix suchowensis]|nr:hypothetical protein IMY05_003G0133600 [Salix suchowensis]